MLRTSQTAVYELKVFISATQKYGINLSMEKTAYEAGMKEHESYVIMKEFALPADEINSKFNEISNAIRSFATWFGKIEKFERKIDITKEIMDPIKDELTTLLEDSAHSAFNRMTLRFYERIFITNYGKFNIDSVVKLATDLK